MDLTFTLLLNDIIALHKNEKFSAMKTNELNYKNMSFIVDGQTVITRSFFESH